MIEVLSGQSWTALALGLGFEWQRWHIFVGIMLYIRWTIRGRVLRSLVLSQIFPPMFRSILLRPLPPSSHQRIETFPAENPL